METLMPTIKTILLIEDDLDISDVTNIFLTSRGYKVEHHFGMDSYEKYLRVVREVKPNLILSDIFVPGIDGKKLCEFVKSDEDLSHIPYILYSAASFSRKEIANFPGEYFLPKPISLDKLESVITEALHGEKERQEAA